MVSGRTDIPAFYSEWFMNRIHEGFIDVRNPFYPKLVNRIMMEDVDLFFFCTKNPIPIVDKLKEINKPIYFHVTLTPYKKDIEPNVPDKTKVIETIKKISKQIGKENIVVRFDPILINDKYTVDYHIKAFERVCTLLDGYIDRILISFIDDYKNVRKNLETLKYRELTEDDYEKIGINFSKIADEHHMYVHTCFEERDLTEYGFVKEDCLSKELAYKLTGKKFPKWHARKGNLCNCVKMTDIGVYNTCKHMCKYCYANFDETKVKENNLKHNPKSSLLIGELKADDEIKITK
jgi:DNA repair photolyase